MPSEFCFEILKLMLSPWKIKVVQIIQRLCTFKLNVEIRNKNDRRIRLCRCAFNNRLGIDGKKANTNTYQGGPKSRAHGPYTQAYYQLL